MLSFYYLCLLLPFVVPQTIEEYLQKITWLNLQVNDYKTPENYEEYYNKKIDNGGHYGHYDFIIIGAGTAGTVLANRLSEVSEWNILLLEAGKNDSVYTDVPALSPFWQFTDYNWGYMSTPQKYGCQGMKNKQCPIPKGKVLGGSSVINYMIYSRGSKEDYDKWAAEGNPGWSYEEVLPYFKKSEQSSLTENVDEDYHGKNGSLSAEHIHHFTDFTKGLQNKILEYNEKEQIVFSDTQGMENNQCPIPKSKILEETSTSDIDKWTDERNPGWSYKDCLKKKDYHRKNGFLSVEHIRHFTDFTRGFLQGAQELGNKILDYNGKDQMGFSRIQATAINGKRCSGNKAFLTPIQGRRNLKVQRAYVTKLNIDSSSKSVKEVKFVAENKLFTATVGKEVILSAGAIGSPQILMHSGIGPKIHLQSLGIHVIKDLPVGQNLADHQILYFPYKTSYVDEGVKPMEEMFEDYLKGKGFLTAPADIQILGFINTNNQSKYPNIEIVISPNFDYSSEVSRRYFNTRRDIFDEYYKPYAPANSLIAVIMLQPKSRGNITLKSANPLDYPLIDLNYFSNPDDVEDLVKGLKYGIKMMQSDSMKKFNVSILNNKIGPCGQDFMSDDYLRCVVRNMASSVYHQTGTCKMGPKEDPAAVVDARLRVKHFKNLRVIDASVIPFPLTAHPTAPVYMIAEKGADIIKQDWKI